MTTNPSRNQAWSVRRGCRGPGKLLFEFVRKRDSPSGFHRSGITR